MSKEEGYSIPNDEWITGGDSMKFEGQQLSLTEKKQCTGFGKQIVSSGRAEWDLKIDLESFGGICVGVFKHSKSSSKNDLTELPIASNFAKSQNGFGYTNKTGALTHAGNRKNYGDRFKANDILTMSVDLLAGSLSYSINGQSQGHAYDLPRGAYRLACKLQFKEQKVSILRFWTSLPRADSTSSQSNVNEISNDNNNDANTIESQQSSSNADNNDNNKINNGSNNSNNINKNENNNTINNSNNDSNNNEMNNNIDNIDNSSKNTQSPQSVNSDNKEESVNSQSLDDNNTDPEYDFEKQNSDEEPTQEESRVLSKTLKKMKKTTSTSDNDNGDIGDINQLGYIGSIRTRGQSTGDSDEKTSPPEPIVSSVKEESESEDYFNVSGSNLSTENPTVLTCIRETNAITHTAYGAHVATHGRMEWILKIEKGHNIVIGVAGTSEHSDALFTDHPFGFGYCDDGNLVCSGGYIEYNQGFQSDDLVGIHLDMDAGELRFSVNKFDQGPAFSGLKVDKNKDINGYRMAVSLQYRPHCVILEESTTWSTNRVSPRPGANDVTFSFTVPHARKLSWKKEKKNKKDGSLTPNNEDDDQKINNNQNGNKSPSNKLKSSKLKQLKDKTQSSRSLTRKLTTPSKDKDKRPKSARRLPKSPRNVKSDAVLRPSKYHKNNVNWQARNGSSDVWERSGNKLEISANKNAINAKNDIKDGNSALGKLVVSNNMKVRWDVKIDQGSRVGLGIMNMEGKSQTAMRKILNSFFTNDIYGYGYFGNDGGIARNGRFKKYGESYKRGDTISIILDLYNKTLSFHKNEIDQGIAFSNIPVGEYRLAMTVPKNRHKITMTKVQIWDAIENDNATSSNTNGVNINNSVNNNSNNNDSNNSNNNNNNDNIKINIINNSDIDVNSNGSRARANT